jgi:hypothetical protein
VIADLELLRIAIETVVGDALADRVVPVLEILDVPVRQGNPTRGWSYEGRSS